MYERMLDKSAIPDEAMIQKYWGRQGSERLAAFEHRLEANYQLVRELKFPFGNGHGWGYKTVIRQVICAMFF